LLRRSDRARCIALTAVRLGMIGAFGLAVAAPLLSDRWELRVLSVPIGHAPIGLVYLALTATVVLALWQQAVLSRGGDPGGSRGGA